MIRATDTQPNNFQRLIWPCLVVAACALAISNDSFWIDEALTGLKARQPTLFAWWQRLYAERMSDLQMPLYMFATWVHAKIFGAAEVSLRAFNIPWILFGGMALANSFPDRTRKGIALVAISISPFAWYYLNEARPYAMQLGASLMLLASLRVWHLAPTSYSRGWFAIFCAGLVILSGASLTGMIWAGSAMLIFMVLAVPTLLSSVVRRNLLLVVTTLGLLVALGVYYLWTMKVGARGGAAAGTNWNNVIFAFYELGGFSGLGPGRNDLRSGGASALRPFLPTLATYGLATVAIGVAGAVATTKSTNRRALIGTAFCLLVPLVFVFAAGFLLHWRVLGRHMTPLAAVWIGLMTMGLSSLWTTSALWRKATVLVFVALSLASCLSLRYATRHSRDGYREAAALAQHALSHGLPVWWNAAVEGADYYGLPMSPATASTNTQGVVSLANPATEQLAERTMPRMVIVSKPDLYDAGGAVAAFLSTNKFLKINSPHAFTVWIK